MILFSELIPLHIDILALPQIMWVVLQVTDLEINGIDKTLIASMPCAARTLSFLSIYTLSKRMQRPLNDGYREEYFTEAFDCKQPISLANDHS